MALTPDGTRRANDIESDSLRGYDKTYSNELRLIAEGTHDIYRIAGNSQVCFEVPADAKRLAEASSSVNIVGASLPLRLVGHER